MEETIPAGQDLPEDESLDDTLWIGPKIHEAIAVATAEDSANSKRVLGEQANTFGYFLEPSTVSEDMTTYDTYSERNNAVEQSSYRDGGDSISETSHGHWNAFIPNPTPHLCNGVFTTKKETTGESGIRYIQPRQWEEQSLSVSSSHSQQDPPTRQLDIRASRSIDSVQAQPTAGDSMAQDESGESLLLRSIRDEFCIHHAHVAARLLKGKQVKEKGKRSSMISLIVC